VASSLRFIGVILGPVLLALGFALGRAWVNARDLRAPEAATAPSTSSTPDIGSAKVGEA